MKQEKFRNFQSRIWFIKHWVKKMKNMSDREWSKGQGRFIDAQFESSRRFWNEHGKTENGKKALKFLLRSKS